jgi:hypothetical protein
VELLAKAVWHELQEARSEQTDALLAVPAREGEPPSSAVITLAWQQHSILSNPNVTLYLDRQGTGLTPMFLAFAVPRGGSWPWGGSAHWGIAEPAVAPAPRAEVARPAVSPLPPEPDADAAGAGVLLPDDAGLAAGFLPANTAVLEQALRQFLSELGDAGRGLTQTLSDHPWVRWAVLAAATALTAELGRRRVRRAARRGAAEEEETATFCWPASCCPFRSADLI